MRFEAHVAGYTHALVLHVAPAATARGLHATLRSDRGGRPGAVLASGSLGRVRGGAWDTLELSAHRLLAGHRYWLTLHGTGGRLPLLGARRRNCAARAVQTRLDVAAASFARSLSALRCTATAYLILSSRAPNPTLPALPAAPGGGSVLSFLAATSIAGAPAPPSAPASIEAPAVLGAAIVGGELQATNGIWSGDPGSFAYQWQRCGPSGTGCGPIPAAVEPSYVPVAADVARTLRVVVTASNAAGSASAPSAATATVAAASPGAPADIVLPAVSGATVEGQTLSASAGTWSGAPTSFSYRWRRCATDGSGCATIPGAGTSHYTLLAADVGSTIRVIVTASSVGGSTHATSAQTGTVTAQGGGGAGGLFISPSGKDSGPCSEAQPCLTMHHAYEQASAGETVSMLSGSYGAQVVEGTEKGSAHVVFAPAAGANVKVTGTTYVFASHVTIEAIGVQDVVVGNYDETPGRPNADGVSLLRLAGRNFEIDSASDVTVAGGSWGPASACGGPYGGDNNSIREPVPGVAPENIVIEDTVIHDVQSYDLTECHIEGLAIFAGNHVTVSDSKFYGNSVYDVFMQANSGGSPDNVVLSGNWLAKALDNSGANGKAVGSGNGVAVGDSGIDQDVTLQANHLNDVLQIDDNGVKPTFKNVKVLENFGMMPFSGYLCGSLAGIEWSKNVWQNDKCGSSDVNLGGAAMPYANASNDSTLDYTLTGTYADWPE